MQALRDFNRAEQIIKKGMASSFSSVVLAGRVPTLSSSGIEPSGTKIRIASSIAPALAIKK